MKLLQSSIIFFALFTFATISSSIAILAEAAAATTCEDVSNNLCPSVCTTKCSDDPLIPLSHVFMENFLEDSIISPNFDHCGDIPIMYPDYEDRTTCSTESVENVMKTALDITSVGIVGVLGAANVVDTQTSARYIGALKAVLSGVTVQAQPLRGVGEEWLYHKDRIITQTGGFQGYYFNHAPCKKNTKLNTTLPIRPDLFTTCLITNAAIVTYATYAIAHDQPESQWPISEKLMVAHLEAFASTLQRAMYADSYIQEFPARAGDHQQDQYFETYSASHAMVLRVADYALTIQHNGYLKELASPTVTTLRLVRTAAAMHVTSSCSRTSANTEDPLIDGFKVYWPTSSSSSSEVNTNNINIGPTSRPVETIPARGAVGTSVFIAALGPVLLQRYCTSIARTAGEIADELVRRALVKFGMAKKGAKDVFTTEGIKYSSAAGNSLPPTEQSCVVDVFQTSWLKIASSHVALAARGCDIVAESLLTSSPFLRTFCRRNDSVSSWQEGDPTCGKPIPSSGLTAYATAAMLGIRIFRDPPSPPPPPTTQTPSPGSNGNGDDNKHQEWKQAVIGVSCGVVVFGAIFMAFRYLQKQSHHRAARLVGGETALGAGRGEYGAANYNGALSSGTFM